MKLHLPVRLFRAVVALMSAVISCTCAADEIISTSSSQIFVDEATDIAANASSDDMFFLVRNVEGGVILEAPTTTIMSSENGSWHFSSAETDDKAVLSVTGSKAYPLFQIGSGKSLTFDSLQSVNFSRGSIRCVNTPWSSEWPIYETINGTVVSGAEGSLLRITNNDSVTIASNSTSQDTWGDTLYARGAAIYVGENGTIDISKNAIVNITGNSHYIREFCNPGYTFGGALYCDGDVVLSENGSLVIKSNDNDVTSWYSSDWWAASVRSESLGGAIYAKNGIDISNNDETLIANNVGTTSASFGPSKSYGGALYSETWVTIKGNGSATFDSNRASASSYDGDSNAQGGAVYADGKVTVSGNGAVLFNDNYSSANSDYTYSIDDAIAYGGAVYAGDDVEFIGNLSVAFIGNKSQAFAEDPYLAYDITALGGAIYSAGDVIISDNQLGVTFSENIVRAEGESNSAWAGGSAIYAEGIISITDNGSVVFNDNEVICDHIRSKDSWSSSSIGGLIDADSIVVENNGDVEISGNSILFNTYKECIEIPEESTEIAPEEGESADSLANSLPTTSVYLESHYIEGGVLNVTSPIVIQNNDSLSLNGNSLTLESDSKVSYVVMSNDIQLSAKGAIATDSLTLNNNGELSICSNTVKTVYSAEQENVLLGSDDYVSAGGGAFGTDVMISGSDSISIMGNKAETSFSRNSTGAKMVSEWEQEPGPHDNSWNSISREIGIEIVAAGGVSNGNLNITNFDSLSISSNEVSASAVDKFVNLDVQISDQYNDVDSMLEVGRFLSQSIAEGGVIACNNWYNADFTLQANNDAELVFSQNKANSSVVQELNGSFNYEVSAVQMANGSLYSEIGAFAQAEGGVLSGRLEVLAQGADIIFAGNSAVAESTVTISDFSTNWDITVEYMPDAFLEGEYRPSWCGEFSMGANYESSASALAGAISSSKVTFCDAKSLVFENNLVSAKATMSVEGISTIINYTSSLVGELPDDMSYSEYLSHSQGYVAEVSAVGGAIASDYILIDACGDVVFRNNGAVAKIETYDAEDSTCDITVNGEDMSYLGSTGISTSVYVQGAAIYSSAVDSKVYINNCDSLTFSNNYCEGGDGAAAVYAWSLNLDNNKVVSFVDNRAVAVMSNHLDIRNSGEVLFENNEGGAIWGTSSSSSNCGFYLFDNDSIVIRNNGGTAVDVGYRCLQISGNGSVCFEKNVEQGALKTGSTAFEISDNSLVSFTDNYSVNGGAVYGNGSFTGNKSVLFARNTSGSNGGAISGTVNFVSNDSVEFIGNSALQFSTYTYGGAVSGSINLNNNGSVLFRENSSRYNYNAHGGGAIHARGTLSICNNDNVLFEKNYERYINYSTRSHVLQSIYVGSSSWWSSSVNVLLSAAESKRIEFRDSVYISTNGSIDFNADYRVDDTTVLKQKGDIIFTGAYTEEHLREVKGGVEGTADEILASRTSEVLGMTNLHGGRLCIEEGAIYKGRGITLHEGTDSSVRLKNGTLTHDGYTLTFNSNTSLELTGNNSISAKLLDFKSGSNILFDFDSAPITGTILTYSGDISVEDKLEIKITGYGVLDHEGDVLLIDFTNADVALSAADFENKGYGQLYYNEDEQNLYFVQADKNVWVGGKKAAWTTGSGYGWQDDLIFRTGNRAVFNTSGTVSIVGEVEPSAILVDIEKNLTFKTSYDKKTGSYTGAIVGDGILVKRGNGTLTLNDGNAYRGATYIEAGTVKAGGATSFGKVGAIYLSGGTLDLASKEVGNNVVQKGNATVKNGGKFTGYYSLEYGELQKGSLINLVGSSSLQSGTINGTLSGKGTAYVYGDVLLGSDGKITTGGLYINGSLEVSSKGMTMDTKSSAISIYEGELSSEGKISAYSLWSSNGSISVSNATPMAVNLNGAAVLENETQANIYGAFSAASLELTDSTFTMDMADEFVTVKNAPKAQSISLKDKYADNLISNSVMNIGGKMSVAGNLTINAGSELNFYDPGTKNKAQSLAVKGSLNFGGGSSLYLNGSLSAKELTLGSGTLTLNGAKLSTVKVGNSLTLEGGTTLNLGFSVKEKDVAKGKSYKVFTFKTIADDITDAMLNELLGLGTDAATLAFDSKRKAITLTVTDAAAWNAYAEYVRTGKLVVAASEDDELVESAGTQVLVAPATVDPMLGKVADTLVQSTWGTAGASRSFGDTIAARGTHATALADGKGSAWISTMGGSSRISSDGAHAGADYTLTGAAFGMETRLSEQSTIGLAIGNSWGKVSTFSAYPVDADSTHQGIYGKHILGSSTTLSWMAAHTRTESDANLAGMACDWTQDALQLDARVDKLFAISDRTTVSAFVGMQYLATDKGECDGLSTGSLQNLRGEIGVSAAHKATDKAYIYGELSFIGDMVRHNPTAIVGDYRSRGANPGRAGLNLSVGASYQLNDSWSLNGSYNLELMQNQTSHSANVGATYSF